MFPDPNERLFEARTVLVHGPLTDATVATTTAHLMAMAGPRPITIYLNAPGGTADAADALYDVIRYAGPALRLVATGAVEGAAALVYVAVPRAARFSLPHARFSLRQPRTGVPGVGSIEAAADAAAQRRERLVATFAEATGQPVDRIEDDLRRGGFLTAEEARDYGLVGRIITRLEELPPA